MRRIPAKVAADRVVIVPGLRNSGPRHWQSHWQRQLPGVVRVEQEQWDVADLERWSAQVAATLQQAGPCWIVAHSFGCLASVHALASASSQVRGVFLVAPADPEKFRVADVLPTGTLPVPGLLVGSLTDPWLSWRKAEYWAQRWQLPLVCAGSAGHINTESGHTQWPAGLKLFQRFQGQGSANPQPVRQWIPVAV